MTTGLQALDSCRSALGCLSGPCFLHHPIHRELKDKMVNPAAEKKHVKLIWMPSLPSLALPFLPLPLLPLLLLLLYLLFQMGLLLPGLGSSPGSHTFRSSSLFWATLLPCETTLNMNEADKSPPTWKRKPNNQEGNRSKRRRKLHSHYHVFHSDTTENWSNIFENHRKDHPEIKKYT